MLGLSEWRSKPDPGALLGRGRQLFFKFSEQPYAIKKIWSLGGQVRGLSLDTPFLFSLLTTHILKTELYQGCIPPTCCPYLPACIALGEGSSWGGVCLPGGVLPGGVFLGGGSSGGLPGFFLGGSSWFLPGGFVFLGDI